MLQILALALFGFQTSTSQATEVGIYPKAIWFLHRYGTVDCSNAKNDREIKTTLAKSFAKDRLLSFDELKEWIDKDVFEKFAGDDKLLSEAELTSAIELESLPSRERLSAELRHHAEFLTTSFDMIDPDHLQAVDQLSGWITSNWKADSSLHVITTCTGNSRRSILGATMGNLAASYYGFDNIHFHSGGTTPSAFNKRTIATLKEIGFQIEPTGAEAERGDPKVPNTVYRVVWGKDLEALEFSKNYKDKSNPQSGFAAILVCNEADAECPTIPNAAIRMSMTFLDPKSYDDGLFEARKYAERRDDVGRTLLAVMANAKRKLQAMRAAK